MKKEPCKTLENFITKASSVACVGLLSCRWLAYISPAALGCVESYWALLASVEESVEVAGMLRLTPPVHRGTKMGGQTPFLKGQ